MAICPLAKKNNKWSSPGLNSRHPLFLLYINDLPECLKSTTPGLYADDTQIFASSDSFDEVVDVLNSDLENISKWLADNKLQHHSTKSKLMFVGSSYSIKN